MDTKFYEKLKSLLKAYDLEGLKSLIQNNEQAGCSQWHNISGNYFVLIGKYEEAVSSYSSAIALDAEEPVYYVNRANAFTFIARMRKDKTLLKKAIDDYDNAIKTKSNKNAAKILLDWGCLLFEIDGGGQDAGGLIDRACKCFDESYSHTVWTE